MLSMVFSIAAYVVMPGGERATDPLEDKFSHTKVFGATANPGVEKAAIAVPLVDGALSHDRVDYPYRGEMVKAVIGRRP